MKILNPTYDTVFKYLLEDLEIAQGLIARILDVDVVDIAPLPQEQTSIALNVKYISIPLLRQDFVAAIRTIENGKEKIQKVIIEMQKSPFPPEVSRFRKYLSEKYHHKTKIDGEEVDLPIITIYLIEKSFNKNLPAILHVANKYYDRLTKKAYQGEKDPFVDLLVHEAYFIQAENLPPDMKDNLLRVLSIFSPAYQIRLGKEDARFIEINEKELNRYKDKLLNLIIRRLNTGVKNNKLLTALEVEISYENEWEKLLKEKEATEQKIKQVQKEKEEAKQREQAAKQKLITAAKTMKQAGMPVEMIKNATGLSDDEIAAL